MKYYLFKLTEAYPHKWDLQYRFDTFDALVTFLRRYQTLAKEYCGNRLHWGNMFLDMQNISGNDVVAIPTENGTDVMYLRTWQLRDENGRILDMREFYEDIMSSQPHRYSYRNWYAERAKHCVYRYDPIPGTGKGHSHYYHVFRHPNHGQVIRQLSQGLLRKRHYQDMESRWWDDDPCRGYQRSWKKQSKRRHQWER